jgi:hypothetical protein
VIGDVAVQLPLAGIAGVERDPHALARPDHDRVAQGPHERLIADPKHLEMVAVQVHRMRHPGPD